jgi:hypothetical protein
MMSRMGAEMEKLFYLLLTRDWDKKKSKPDSFVKMPTEKKEMSRVVKVVQSKMDSQVGLHSSCSIPLMSKERTTQS